MQSFLIGLQVWRFEKYGATTKKAAVLYEHLWHGPLRWVRRLLVAVPEFMRLRLLRCCSVAGAAARPGRCGCCAACGGASPLRSRRR